MILFKFSPINSLLRRGLLNIGFNTRSYCKSPDESVNENKETSQDDETITLNFVKANGKKYQVKGIIGLSLRQCVMQAGLNNEFNDYGFCGGNRWCTSCHVIFEPEMYQILPKMSDVERHYAEFLLNYQADHSRLGCQVFVTKEMDGANLLLPRRFPDDD